ncbi:hypothetical protein PG994_012703 [Apiospora phragmitis]|uniref:Arylamine N-acetyltransferase n=1 Tax=Apiospora phragmitis TaxID=2905665 RepID=A0ABR1TD38_9PEZI
MADRPTYSRAQLEQYFDRIVLPQPRRVYSVTEQLGTAAEQLAYLTRLMKHQVVKVPFENLSLHYSWHRTIATRPQLLFRKIVEKQQHTGAGRDGDGDGAPRPLQCHRGGYCMEVNSFFHTVLRSLGYHVYLAGARVYDPSKKRYGGFSHCVNIVTLMDGADGVLQKYMVDVAFGANESAAPLPLATPGTVHTQVAPAQMWLVHEALPQQLNQDCACWIYQSRIHPEKEWTPAYCFVDFEFLPEDIAGMNLSPWKSPGSFFHQKVLVVRFTTDREKLLEFPVDVEGGGLVSSGGGIEEDDAGDGPGSPDETAVAEGELDGAIILDHDKLKLDVVLQTDAARVEALRRYFGIVLDEEDLVAIKGTKGEIKA